MKRELVHRTSGITRLSIFYMVYKRQHLCVGYYPSDGLQTKVLGVFCACWGRVVGLYTGLRARQTGLFTSVAHHTSLLHEVYTYCTGYIIVQYPNQKKEQNVPLKIIGYL